LAGFQVIMYGRFWVITEVKLNRSVAFGDSMSDYLLFQELEHTVAINGDPTLRGLARYHYEGADLHEAFLTICDALKQA